MDKKPILLNAFSLNMLGDLAAGTIAFRKLTLHDVKTLLEGGFTSAVGHADTAVVLSGLLGWEVPFNRATVTLEPGDQAIVAQYRGPRLPEGATTLPEGAVMEFYLVTVL